MSTKSDSSPSYVHRRIANVWARSLVPLTVTSLMTHQVSQSSVDSICARRFCR